MRILIIEDEPRTAELIVRLINQYDKSYSVIGIIDSVKNGNKWFDKKNVLPDLILADIQLSDGTSFDLFDKVESDLPVIFITAFNEYALEAFKLNSIDYLLKPLNFSDLKKALDKFKRAGDIWFKTNREGQSEIISYDRKNYKHRFLVKSGKTYKSLLTDEVASFRAENGFIFACTKNGGQSIIENNITELTLILDPEKFFQINRNTIINIDAIDKISEYFNRRLIIRILPERHEEIVSRERVQSFKEWLDK